MLVGPFVKLKGVTNSQGDFMAMIHFTGRCVAFEVVCCINDG